MPAFWDTSAVLCLCVPGQASAAAKQLLRRQPPVVWWGTPVEVQSGLARLLRMKHLSPAAHAASSARLGELLHSWREVAPTSRVRDLAMAQLAGLPLTSSDALQLAAALVWCRERPRGRIFVCNDVRLAQAAETAGFHSMGV